ncbi:unnamed protein product [Clonostachys byssicola]|uniref:F-box domain-containing protein n=1 Tax=Clonostachys byssicola TaxID=160290 RepID=A0A9N9Y0U9_9HYPO|nr:unnamed protein product [Clonostachys byssicola]
MDTQLTPQPAASSTARLIHSALPIEVLHLICGHLPNSDIKNLRLTSSFFATTARLDFRRVFLSANSRNIEVFLAVANHSVFRTQVVEIIYDDALLPAADNLWHGGMSLGPSKLLEDQCAKGPPPRWIRQACRRDLEALIEASEDERRHKLEDYLSQDLTWQKLRTYNWEMTLPYYFKLLRDQEAVLEDESYVKALRFGLAQFAALRKITVTAATHGRLFNPLYHTPMIRQFPRLFQYPIPHGWLRCSEDVRRTNRNWATSNEGCNGFNTIIEALAENLDGGRVTELSIDAHLEYSGIDVDFLKNETKIFQQFEAVLARKDFASLKLDLSGLRLVDRWGIMSNGLLRRALSGARDLRHLSLSTSEGWSKGYRTHPPRNPVPLRSMIPKNCSARLQHLTLRCFWVEESDLVAFLSELPEELETLELSYLNFSQGSYRGTLEQIRDGMDWQNRERKIQINISIHGVGVLIAPVYGKSICIDEEVHAFLYEKGPNPFSEKKPKPNAIFRNLLEDGVGIITDAFDSQIPPFDQDGV